MRDQWDVRLTGTIDRRRRMRDVHDRKKLASFVHVFEKLR